MAVTQAQKVDYLWKKLGYGRTKTDTNANKKAFNEAIASPLLLRGDKIWNQSSTIPGTLPGSSSGAVTVYPTSNPVECTVDGTATANRTWKTGSTDWIPPELGSTYLVKVYVHTSSDAANAASSGTTLSAAGSGNDDEWFFDYQSGVLHFIGDNLPNGVSFSGKSVYISGARYTGSFGLGGASSGNFTGISTFSDTTDNTLGNADTGALQVDGGLGVNKNVTVGANLFVQGYSEFVGVVTFKGGTIGLGDADTDTITVGGEFGSSLIPTDDDTHSLGEGSKRWKNGSFSGIITASSFVGDITGIAATATTLETARNFSVSGDVGTATSVSFDGTGDVDLAVTLSSNFDANTSGIITSTGGFVGDLTGDVTGDLTGEVNATSFDTNASGVVVTGIVTATTGDISGNLTVGGNLFVNGSTTQVNTSTLTVEDALIEVGLVDGSAPGSDLNLDLGLLLNYYDGSAKKAAVYWDDSAARIVVASDVSESSGTLTASSYAGLEVGSLYVNDCAGQSQVITCTGSERFLENITIDCGSF